MGTMSSKEMFQAVNKLDIPAEMTGEIINYIEEFDCEGNDHHKTALNILKDRNVQLATVGLQISNPSLELQTLRGRIIAR